MAEAVKLKEAHIDLSLCRYGHDHPKMAAFMQKYRRNIVPIRNWGGKTVTNV